MEQEFVVPQVVRDHYAAFQFSPECVTTMRDIVEQHESLPACPPWDVKKIVKVGCRMARFASDELSCAHLDRLHGYAHDAIHALASDNRSPRLQAHLYCDAADINRARYLRTRELAVASEAANDYFIATKRSPSTEVSYRLGCLRMLGEMGLQILVDHGEDTYARTALRGLDAFPYWHLCGFRSAMCGARDLSRRLRRALPAVGNENLTPQAF